MPPQPIDRVKPGAHYRLHFDNLDDRKDLAQAVAECVLKWSRVEVALGYVYVALLRGNQEQGAAMYVALESGKAKRDAIQTLAVSGLDALGAKLVQALLICVKAHQKSRDKIAHWMWGTSDELPDHMVLADPKRAWASAGLNQEALRAAKDAGEALSFKMKGLSREDVYVYSLKALREDATAFESLSILATKFTMLVSGHPTSPRYAALCNELVRDARLAAYKDRLQW